ncbi:condensation domain-containing protein [Streptomyces sp. NPDC015139]|uniref:phthiocerol/phthiodiolone dimycocerosyl transferase family protein n=1 Tax=Streptomyces sp. NPDC015139 TaxID=3364942 RepID=UPI0036F4CC6F
MHRMLCPVETLYVGQRSRGVISSALRGHLDVAALSAAFDAVTQAHPSLRSRIVPEGEGFALQLLAEAERPRLATRTGDTDAAHAAELNMALPVGGPLSRAVLVSAPRGDDYLFVLSVDHTIADGHSSIALHHEVWNRYRALVEGVGSKTKLFSVADGTLDWPAPVSGLLPAADSARTADYLELRIEETLRRPAQMIAYDVADPSAVEGRIEVCRVALDEERTSRLRHCARAVGVSVHAVIAAALLATARRRLHGDEPLPLSCLSPVDLRSRLSPPVPALVMIPAVTAHLQTLDVTPGAELGDLACTIHARLSDFVTGEGPYHEMRIMPEVPRSPTLQLATVIVTNMGVVPEPRMPEGLEITDARLVPARERYFPQAERSPVMACVVSFEGRLTIEFPYFTACFSPAFVQALGDEVRAALIAFTEGIGPACPSTD